MAVRPDYDIGELTLTSGSADFTTSGSSLQTASVQAGDAIIAPSGHVLIIASITGQNSGTLFLPCPPDAAGTGLPLRIRFQPDGSRYQGAVRNLIDLLSSGNLEAFAALVGAAGMVPIFTGPGTLDLADPATFGIQDPNGSLGKLAALTAFPIAGLMNGFGISNDPSNLARSIVVSPGVAIDDISSASIALASGMSKGLNTTWQAGSGFGGLDVGAVAASTWYHVFAIVNPATGNSDILFSGSLTNPTLPTGYTKKRRIASIFTDASANIIPFVQSGDYFAFKTPVLNVAAASSGGSTPRSISVTTPFGLKVDAVFGCTWGSSSSNGDFVFATVYDPDLGGATTDKAIARLPPGQTFTAQVKSQTDNSARIMHWTNAPGEGDATISVWTHGYYDTRGRI